MATAQSHKNDIEWTNVGRKQYERYDGARIEYNHNRFLWIAIAADGTKVGGYAVLWAAKAALA